MVVVGDGTAKFCVPNAFKTVHLMVLERTLELLESKRSKLSEKGLQKAPEVSLSLKIANFGFCLTVMVSFVVSTQFLFDESIAVI
jgi:hypothetical protein